MKVPKIIDNAKVTISKEFKIYRLRGERRRLLQKLLLLDRYFKSEPVYDHAIRMSIQDVDDELRRLED